MNRLGEITKIEAGQAAPTEFSKIGFPFIRAGHLKSLISGQALIDLDKVSESTAKKKRLKLIPTGTILFAKSGMSATKNRVYLTNAPAYFVSHLAAILPNKNYDSNYLKYYLSWFKPSKLIVDEAYPSIRLSEISNLKIPLPPLETQRKIAAILDKADELIQNDKKTLEKYDQLAHSVFLEMFGDPQLNNKNWLKQNIGELSSDIKYGTNNKAFEFSTDNKIPVLRIPNVSNGKINLINLKYTNVDEKEYRKLLLRRGDLLFVRSNGNPDYIGRCAVFNLKDEYLYASYLIRVRLIVNAPIFSYILSFIINFPTFRARIIREARTTAGNYNLNTQGLKSYEIILPPIELQKRFLEIITHIKTQKQLTRQSLQKSEELFNSLLQGVFRPTGRNENEGWGEKS